MTSLAVTVNIGSGPGNTSARTEGMRAWAVRIVAEVRPTLVFAQEVPSYGWVDVWTRAGYQEPILGPDRGWRIRSALIADSDVDVRPLTIEECPTLQYHGSYLAAALWRDAPGGPCAVVSVHASPSPAEPDRYGWDGVEVLPRDGGGDPRWRGRTLWDSDLVLATLAALARPMSVSQGRLLAAGDFNESLLDDVDEHGVRRGTWGTEYFTHARRHRLHDVSARDGVESLPTRGHLQLDHVLVSEAARDVVDGGIRAFRDPAWSDDRVEGLSDHTPVWFGLAPSGSRPD